MCYDSIIINHIPDKAPTLYIHIFHSLKFKYVFCKMLYLNLISYTPSFHFIKNIYLVEVASLCLYIFYLGKQIINIYTQMCLKGQNKAHYYNNLG